jgi:Carboxypeptidase regulatory-like domain
MTRSRSSILRNFRFALVGILSGLFWLSAAPIQAQLAGNGAITGTVTDPSGAVIPNATVTVVAVDTNQSTVRHTTTAGDYNVTPLPPGAYTVTLTAGGFEKYVQQNVNVNALETVSLNIKMTIGEAGQTVTVTTMPPNITTTDATLGGAMENVMYSNLPLQMSQGGTGTPDQRRATDFEYLMPGVQNNWVGSNNSTQASGIINGSGPAAGAEEMYIDGLDMSTPQSVGDPRFIWTAMGVDAVSQFQVLTASWGAQYGGQGVENYSVRQGGNAIHGAVYEYFRNKALDAWQFASKKPTPNAQGVVIPGGIKPRENQNEYGIVLSGPIIKNKLFLFYNYGQYREAAGPTTQAQTAPTCAMMGYAVGADGNCGAALGYADYTAFSSPTTSTPPGTGDAIYDPNSQTYNCQATAASPCARTQFMGLKNGVATANVIPGSRISQVANYYDQFLIASSAEKIVNQNLYANNLLDGYSSGLSNWYQTGRLDYNVSQKNQLSLIIAFGRQASTGFASVQHTSPLPVTSNQLPPPFNTNQTYAPQTTVDMVKDVYTITPSLVNQFAVGYARYKSASTTDNDAAMFNAASSGLVGMPPGQAMNGFPAITFSSPDQVNTEGGYAWNTKASNSYNITDNLLWIKGKHSFTIGGQGVRLEYNYIKVATASGPMGFTFSPTETGSFTGNNGSSGILASSGAAYASYMLGAVHASSVTANYPETGSRFNDFSYWVQDDFKVNSQLTVNLGLRWDIFPPYREAHNLFTYLNPTATNPITGNLGTLEFAGPGAAGIYSGSTSTPTSFRNFGPHIGLAYSIDPKTVVRAGYLITYAHGNNIGGAANVGPSLLGLTPAATAPPGLSSAPAFYWDQANAAGGSYCSGGVYNGSGGVACGWTGSIVAPTTAIAVANGGNGSLATYGTGNASSSNNGGVYYSGTGTGQNGVSSSTPAYYDPYLAGRAPEYENWNIGVQREITKDMSILISYVGAQGHFVSDANTVGTRNGFLPESYAALAGYNAGSPATPCSGAGCTASLLASATKATAANIASAQAIIAPPNPYTTATYQAKNSLYQYYLAFPQYKSITDATSFVGNTNFNALEVTLKQRTAHGLDMMLNYTYSKTIDDLGTFRVGDNPRLDRSLSAADEPQNLAATAVYQLPFGRGHIGGDSFWVRAFASDWGLSGIVSYHSGFPIAVTGSGCGTSDILNQCMPSVVAGQPARVNGSYGKLAGSNTAATYTTQPYINPNAFTVATNATYGNTPGVWTGGAVTPNSQVTGAGSGPALYVPGNAARVAALNLWGPSLFNLDLGLKRSFPIYREAKLLFEVDALNALNHVVFSAPNAQVNGGSSFGELTSVANTARDFQLSARIQW